MSSLEQKWTYDSDTNIAADPETIAFVILKVTEVDLRLQGWVGSFISWNLVGESEWNKRLVLLNSWREGAFQVWHLCWTKSAYYSGDLQDTSPCLDKREGHVILLY